jgi:hypothetical protein
MKMLMLQLQEKFIAELTKSAGEEWDRIDIHYEYFPWQGTVIENYTSKVTSGEAARQLPLSFDVLEVVLALNECKPEGQTEKWTWFEFTMESDGSYKFEYKYGMPPLAADEIKYA